MKTNVFFKAVVMVVVVMASVMSANAGNPTNYVKNDEMNGEQLVAKTIYRNEDGHLFRHLRYTYTYDSENRVVCKEAAKWDSVKACWTPYFKLNVSYHSDAVEMNYAKLTFTIIYQRTPLSMFKPVPATTRDIMKTVFCQT